MKNLKSKGGSIALIIISILLLLAIGGGAFYLCYVDSVTITNGQDGTFNLAIGDEGLINAELPDKIYINNKIKFTTSDPSIVTVDSNGKYKAKSVGIATITATTEFFNRTDSVSVHVGYGIPDEVSVETTSGKVQYVGDSLTAVKFTATTSRKGELSQDPYNVSFKWEIYDITNIIPKLIKTEVTTTNTYEFTYPTNEYKKIKAVCTVVYKNEEKPVKDNSLAVVYEKTNAEDIKIETSVDNEIVDLTSPIEMGKTIHIRVINTNPKANPNVKTKWSYEVNGTNHETDVESNNVKLEITQFGAYKIKGIITEQDRTFSISPIEFNSKYQPVKMVVLDREILKQRPEAVKSFNVEATWNKFANPDQNVTFGVIGIDHLGDEKVYEVTVNGQGSAQINVSPQREGDLVKIYVNQVDTGVIIDLNDTAPTITIYAKIGTIESQNRLSYEVTESEVENVKIVASTDSEFDLEESNQIVGRNNFNGPSTTITVGTKYYPTNSYGSVDWYVNGVKQSTKGSTLTINTKDIGEYHIYCVLPENNVKSNTLVIPSTSKSINSSHFNYLGDINGRSVNTYVTSQSDMDSLLEYCVLNDEKHPSVYIDSCMQDIWQSNTADSSIYNGEMYWIRNSVGGYYYVNSGGYKTSNVICNINGKGEEIGMLSRSFYRINYSGNFSTGSVIQQGHLNRETTLDFTVLPTATPTKVSGQKEYSQQGFRPYTQQPIGNVRSFPIDEITETVKVSTSSELYDAIENGYRPVCEVGSMAERIYKEARKVLTTYVSDDMTDLQKVKFIHDWICYEVTYDYAVTTEEFNKMDTNESLKYSAFYLEGIFSLSGTIFNEQVAVCDGRSKAFTLMCSIEGIRSVRVTGTCYDDPSFTKIEGGHAWNKVYLSVGKDIPPKWYVVDTTWDDLKMNDYKETTTYDYFLVSDKYHNNKQKVAPNKYAGFYCKEDQNVKGYPKAETEYKYTEF